MLRSTLRRLYYYLNSHYGLILRPEVEISLFGKKLRIIKGSFRTQPDYDDAWSLALAMRSKVVFDVGANVGQSALLFLQCRLIERLVLIDPNPQALAIAAQNLFQNYLTHNINFVAAFASNTMSETLQFWTLDAGAAGSIDRTLAQSASKAGSSIVVPTITLNFLADYLQLIPDFIKIDVEGAENMVLDGAKEIASNKISKILVEMHSSPSLSMTSNIVRLLQWCEETGYSAWYLAEHLRISGPEPVSHRGRCHILLLPNTEKYPEYLKALKQGAPLSDALPPDFEST